MLYSLTPGVSGQVALAALVIYHLTIHTRDPPHIYIYIYVTCYMLITFSMMLLK